MQQLIDLWQSLDLRRQIITIGATVGMFLAVWLLAGVATKPSMALLYAGLDGSRAGEVLAALDQRGVNYEVRGDAVYVDGTRRDALRMDLAAEGLPANSGAGYELLDSLSGFGTTAQMFDAAYWRAKEGELARTIATLPDVRSARVHLSNVEPQGFGTAAQPKASVTVTTRAGGLAPPQVRALRFLVSAAVEGMTPADVAVIDSVAGLVEGDAPGPGKAGDTLADDLRQKVTRLLEARVGSGKARVEVAVDTATDSETVSERTIDPKGRVAISSETEENSSSGSDTGGAAVTVASNLPSGQGAGGGGKSSQKSDNQSRERVNYEVSETRRELVKAPGAVRRLTIAILVDGVTTTKDTGESQWTARPDDELATLGDLAAAAVGLNKDRGDVLTIRSLAFEPPAPAGSEAPVSFLARLPVDVMSLVQLAVLALVSLVLGLFVLRPILTGRSAARLPALAAPLPAPSPALTGVIEDVGPTPAGLALPGQRPQPGADPALEEPVARLRRMIAERQDETVEVLRSWMNEPAASEVNG